MRGSACPNGLHVFMDDILEGSCGGYYGSFSPCTTITRAWFVFPTICQTPLQGKGGVATLGQGEFLPHMEEFKYSGERGSGCINDQ